MILTEQEMKQIAYDTALITVKTNIETDKNRGFVKGEDVLRTILDEYTQAFGRLVAQQQANSENFDDCAKVDSPASMFK